MAEPVMLITGASSGIGAAVATRAARAGYALAVAGRSADPLRALAEKITADRADASVLPLTCDVADWDDQQAMLSAITDRYGRLDVAVVNAGLGGGGGFRDGDVDRWRAIVLTNVFGTALTLRAALPALLESRGRVVLTGSVTGRVSVPGSLYSATKWAVTEIAQSVRAELHGTGVRITVVQPGVVDTPFYGPGGDEAHASMARSDTVLQADDVARTVLWALDQPDHVDLSEIVVRAVSDQL